MAEPDPFVVAFISDQGGEKVASFLTKELRTPEGPVRGTDSALDVSRRGPTASFWSSNEAYRVAAQWGGQPMRLSAARALGQESYLRLDQSPTIRNNDLDR